MTIEELAVFLPKYLSTSAQEDLFEGLKDFPQNIDMRFYTDRFRGSPQILQGDGINNLLVVNLPSNEIRPAPGMILSNSCDNSLDNKRYFSPKLVYATIFNLNKYEEKLRELFEGKEDNIASHIAAIKEQRVTQIFYLPEIEGRLLESIVFFDTITCFTSSLIERETIPERKIFTLSDLGLYLFLFKLSVHFTRIRENIERGSLKG